MKLWANMFSSSVTHTPSWGFRYWKKHPLLIRAAEKQAGKNMQNRHPPFVNVHILLRRRFALETRRGYPSRSAKGMLMTLSAMRCLSGSLSDKKTCWSMFEWLWKSVIVVYGFTGEQWRLKVYCCTLRVEEMVENTASYRKVVGMLMLRCPQERCLNFKLF